MKPENQLKLADELFAEISAWKFPADKFLNNYFRNNRFVGSKDRRFISDYVYSKIRSLGDCPEWLLKYFPPGYEDEIKALNTDAPTDLRANPLKADVNELLAQLDAETIEGLPLGIRLKKRMALKFDGSYEVQDAGSQLVTEYAAPKPGGAVLDYCAGAGGKTLNIAALMNNNGFIKAHDVDQQKLFKLKNRAEKAGATIIKTGKPQKNHDLVLVDAPCSGTGTWRRSPDAKWRLTESRLQHYIELQRQILAEAATYVKPGGRLVYITCSLLPCENEKQVEWFLSKNKDFKKGKEPLKLSPLKTGTDGFFAAELILE